MPDARPRDTAPDNTPATLPPNADERVARFCGWWKREWSEQDQTGGVVRCAKWIAPNGSEHMRPPAYSTDANAWAEVHKVLEEQGVWNDYGYSLLRALCPWALIVRTELPIEWSVVKLFTFATPAERTAALLIMELQDG